MRSALWIVEFLARELVGCVAFLLVRAAVRMLRLAGYGVEEMSYGMGEADIVTPEPYPGAGALYVVYPSRKRVVVVRDGEVTEGRWYTAQLALDIATYTGGKLWTKTFLGIRRQRQMCIRDRLLC